MPEEKDKIKKLYDTFVSDGYDMESEEDFRKNLLDSTKRKAAYDALVKMVMIWSRLKNLKAI